MAYFWGTEEAEDIFDSVPPRMSKRKKKPTRASLKCLAHDKALQEQFLPVLADLHAEWPCPLIKVIQRNVVESLCSCDMRKVPVLNIPRELFEENICKSYTFFQNVFNLIEKDTPSGKLGILKDAVYDMVEDCAMQKEVTRYIFLQNIKALFVAALNAQEDSDGSGTLDFYSTRHSLATDSDCDSLGSESDR